jgi:hypothetical protein
MHQVSCPNCGSTITFRAGETVYAVCDYCSTALVRSDVSVESIGKVAILQDAWSPLQLGTEGDFDGGHFFVVGQVVYRWDSGTWTEWYLTYNDGRFGWMTEAQGHFALTFPAKKKIDLSDPSQISVGAQISVDGVLFNVVDIKPAEVASSRGELPFKALPGRKITCIDLNLPAGQEQKSGSGSTKVAFASLEFSESGANAFLGRYQDFESLRFVNLRQIHGW